MTIGKLLEYAESGVKKSLDRVCDNSVKNGHSLQSIEVLQKYICDLNDIRLIMQDIDKGKSSAVLTPEDLKNIVGGFIAWR